MMHLLLLFAQDVDRFNQGLKQFQWGITLAGIAILLPAAVAILQKPKEGKSPIAQRVVGIVLGMIGVGLIAYAWLGFSPM